MTSPLSCHIPRVLVLCWTLCVAAPALAQHGWSGVVWSSENRNGSTATDTQGNLFVVWSPAGSGHLEVSRRDWTTGTWTDFGDISGPATGSASIVVDAGGHVTVAWYRWYVTHSVVRSRRYDPTTGAWSATADLDTAGVTPDLAVDAAGNVTAVWASPVHTHQGLRAARFSVASGQWSAPVQLVSAQAGGRFPDVAADADGNAVAVWSGWDGGSPSIRAARFDVAMGSWGAPVTLSAPTTREARVAMDAEGNALVAWVRESLVQVTRYARATASWGTPVDIATGAGTGTTAHIAVNAAGDAMLVWDGDAGITTSRYARDVHAWEAPVPHGRGWEPGVALDGAGNAIATWSVLSLPPFPTAMVYGRRYVADTGTWDALERLGQVSGMWASPRAGFDSRGHALVSWNGGGTTWLASPGPPAIQTITPGTGLLSVHLTAPPTPEPAFAAVNYEYSVDDGSTWTVRSPASLVSPLVVGGLDFGIPYRVRVRAVNVAGSGTPSATTLATPGPFPGPPLGLVASSIDGQRVTLRWSPPPNSVAPDTYVMEAGLAPGDVRLVQELPASQLTLTIVAPSGAFYVRVHARIGLLRSMASNEIRVFVNQPVPPSAPAGLLALVNGRQVTLSWMHTFEGGAPTTLWLRVTGDVSATVPLPFGERVTFLEVPTGRYTLSVVAANASGSSPSSNAVAVAVPGACGGVPDAPTTFTASVVGRTITLMWDPPASGRAVTGYTVSVSGAYAGQFATTGRTLSGTVGPGTYTLAVNASNPCGTGPSTAPHTVVVP